MRKRRVIALTGIVLCGLVVGGSLAHRAGAGAAKEPVSIAVKRIDVFRPGSSETRFGRLEFVGGLVLKPSTNRVSGLSSIRLGPDRSRLLAITDYGDWLSARIDRDAAGRAIGLSNVRVAPLLGENGRPLDGKMDADAESLAIEGDRVLVGFERNHRILSYGPASDPLTSSVKRVPTPIPRASLKTNRGLETIAVSPKAGPLNGAAVAIAEQSLDPAGNHLAAIFDGRRNGPFTVKRDDPFDVTDGAFLPSGDLLILERRFSPLRGVGMRIRQIAGGDIKPGALVDGPVIMEADMRSEIDNMEGLDASVGPDGVTYLTLVSDDNDNFLQRSLLLEFKLLEPVETAATPSN